MTQHHDYFNLDFCTVFLAPFHHLQNLIESAQETAGRRLSLFIENNHLQWGFLPRTYKLFDLFSPSELFIPRKVTLFDMEYRLLLIRVFAYRYSHPHETVRFLNPSTSQEVVFPPCLVTAETCNPEYRKGSVVDQKYVSLFRDDGAGRALSLQRLHGDGATGGDGAETESLHHGGRCDDALRG